MTGFVSLSRAMALGLLRDRAAVFFTLVFPLMFLLLFGALFKDTSANAVKIVQVGSVAVFDELPDVERERLRPVLEIERTSGSKAALEQALEKVRTGEVDGVVYQRETGSRGSADAAGSGAAAGAGGQVELRVSAADPAKAGSVRSIVSSIVQEVNLRATGQPPRYTLGTDRVEDKSVQAIQFLTPGLLGWAVAMGAVFGTAYNLVSWRKKRILRRLWLAPVGAGSVVGARIGVNLALALAQTAIFLAVATLPYYGLQLSGDWWLCVPLILSATLAFMSIGLVVGAWAKTEEAANGLAQLIVLPMAFLSGSFFPLDSAPEWVQTISRFLPLRHLADALQGVLSRGESWATALPVIGGMLLFGAVLTLVARSMFRWDTA
ncbi:ABC transporter permease [Streptomyces durbertensis]|uniref:ABC transporter permease n=1 Tax=Streptomyces durbertensis TaxID=2448886 RepID=A0ABR6EE56_9ACTN|nr:ABC transporter permease [Streptomyces durbertensis]MBB1243240.1 ABC transporter permease [Streptomyces durbertensis]